MKLLIAGGGTGGHLFAGIAVAEDFLKRNASNEVLFVGTRQGIEATVIPKKKYPLHLIWISGWVGQNWFEKILTLISIPVSFVQSIIIVWKEKPDLVLGIGGYASFPVIVASFFLRKKRAIHEQNIRPGVTNRCLAWFVQKIFVSFEESEGYFPKEKVYFSGNPIRVFKELSSQSCQDKFTIFIFGGRQGAHSLNRSMLDALPLLSDIKDKIQIIHQAGKRDINWVESTYFQNQWKSEVYDFIDDIASVYARSDYVICRAGATSLAELSALKKACLLIPYPFAAHGHQELNARSLEKKNAARVLLDWKLDGQQLSKEIKWAFNHPRELEEMRKNIVQFSHPYAAKAIVDQLI